MEIGLFSVLSSDNKSMSEKGKTNKKKTGLGLALWLLAFLIILIVFLVKQEEIKGNFEKSGASALIEKKIGKDVFDGGKDSPKKEDTGVTIIDVTKNQRKSEELAKTESDEKTEPAEKTAEAQKSSDKPETNERIQADEESPKITQTSTDVQEKPEPPKTVAQTESKPVSEPESKTIKKKICFVAIDSDGPVVRKEVTRNVQRDSPMGDALNMLLAGPSATESQTGCRSFIPAGTRLIGASVQNGIATLNFSEEFQFNQFGAEGSLAQLMQVVYTATEYSTVKSVQILIEGQKKAYLTEGVWIGSPLNRSGF